MQLIFDLTPKVRQKGILHGCHATVTIDLNGARYALVLNRELCKMIPGLDELNVHTLWRRYGG
jgi:hypothetical protein